MAQWDNYSQKSTPADTDTLMLKDNAATGKPNKRLLFSGLWTWIVDKLTNATINALQTTTKTVVGGMNNLQDAVTTLNNRTKTYDYTASSGSFLDWVLSTFTTNGNYYVIYATTNWTGWAGSNTGICKVIRRNNDYYLEAYIGDTATATNQSFYINRYTGGSWLGWTKIPSRYEMEVLNSKTSGFATSLGVDMNQNKTYEIITTQGYPIYFMFGQATGGSPFAVIIGGGGLTTANPTVYYQTVGSQTIIESVTAETNKIIIKFSNNYAQFTIMSRQVFTGQVKS